MYSLNPTDHKWVNNTTIHEWRKFLRAELLRQRDYTSDYSGKRLHQVHMHEGIITRGRLPKNVKWHYRIFHPFNCFLLLPDEHIPNPPSVGWAIAKSYELYGRENVREWFYGLPWKSVPFKLL